MEIARNEYANYYSYLNNSYLYANMKQDIQSNNEEKVDKKKPTEVRESPELSKEEVSAVYFNYQSNQAMKSRIDVLLESESVDENEETLSIQDIHEVQKQKNRNILIGNYSSQNLNTSNFNIWA